MVIDSGKIRETYKGQLVAISGSYDLDQIAEITHTFNRELRRLRFK